MGNAFTLLMVSSGILFVVCYLFCRPIIFLFGGSEASYVYADEYLKISLFGTALRKVIIVTPLTILLPMFGFGVNGVFLAEPISNVVGGLICFVTMWKNVYKKL